MKYLLIPILILGLFLRLNNLDSNPYGLFCDEASIGYDAYSLSKNGTDEWGVKWPIFFKAFGEFKSPVMIYSTIPFVAILGLSDFSTRLPSVVWGVLGIYALYLLGSQMYDKKIGLISSFLLSISPWHIHLSRVAFELMPYTTLLMFGVTFWLKYIQHSKIKYGLISAIFLIMSIYSYFPGRVFVPLLGVVMIFTSTKTLIKNRRHFFILAIFAVLLSLPLIMHMTQGEGMSRWEMVKGDNGYQGIVTKYKSYFSFDYLFFKGDIDYNGQFITRHSIRGIGQLYLFQLPLIFFGIAELYRRRKSKLVQITLLAWLVLYPIPDIFTAQTSPYATRTIIGVIPFQIISSLGVMYLVNLVSKSRAKLIIYLAFISVLYFYVNNFIKLHNIYPLYSSDYWGWQSGPKQIMKYFVDNQSEYQLLCLEGQFNAPDIFLKFYDPENKCQGKCSICGYDRYNPSEKQLYAISKETYDKLGQQLKFTVLNIINYPNGQPSFYIGEINEKIN